MVDAVATDGLLAAVVNVATSVGGQRPQVVGPRSTGTCQQLPVPQNGNQVRRCRWKRVKPADGLQDASPDRPPEGGIIHPQPRQGGPPCSSATYFQCFEDIHPAMLDWQRTFGPGCPESMWTAPADDGRAGRCHAGHAARAARRPGTRNSEASRGAQKPKAAPRHKESQGSSLPVHQGVNPLSPFRADPGPVRCRRRPGGPPGCPSPAGRGGMLRGPGSRRPGFRVHRRPQPGR